jgi:hypothetical protein
MEMAFRSETKTVALLILSALPVSAQVFEGRHAHWRKGAKAELRVTSEGISFKDAKHSGEWKFGDIQRLVLEPRAIRIVTYEDQRLQLYRDREILIDQLPENFGKDLYPLFRAKLDQRFVAALSPVEVKPVWQADAKLLRRLGGSDGTLMVMDDSIVYKSAEAHESRSWRITDIDLVSSSGVFDLAITTLEKEFRFQLKRPLTADEYKMLWRNIQRAKGLSI